MMFTSLNIPIFAGFTVASPVKFYVGVRYIKLAKFVDGETRVAHDSYNIRLSARNT
jgi:Sec-independent protein secretion pathway component TatC